MDFTNGTIYMRLFYSLKIRTGEIYIFISDKKEVLLEFTCYKFNPKIDYL
jgi:hypothetical protein